MFIKTRLLCIVVWERRWMFVLKSFVSRSRLWGVNREAWIASLHKEMRLIVCGCLPISQKIRKFRLEVNGTVIYRKTLSENSFCSEGNGGNFLTNGRIPQFPAVPYQPRTITGSRIVNGKLGCRSVLENRPLPLFNGHDGLLRQMVSSRTCRWFASIGAFGFSLPVIPTNLFRSSSS